MKKSFYILLSIICFFATNLNAQQTLSIDGNTVIKDASGNIINPIQLKELMDSGEWTIEPHRDEQGNISYIQVVPKTNSDEKPSKKELQKSINNNVIGTKAPDFNLVDLEGKKLSSDELEGKVVVLNFWFTTCKPCVKEMPDLNKVYQEFKDDTNVVFAAITFDKQPDTKKFLAENEFLFPVYVDAMDVCKSFKISQFPTTIVLDKKGFYYNYILGSDSKIEKTLALSISENLK